MSFDVSGKNVLVTGGNRGIGKAIVEAALERGAAKVYVAVRNVDSARPLVERHGERVVPVPLDLTRPETITAAAQTASDVQLVVNNAGVLKVASPLSDEALDSLQFELDVNVFGLVRVARAFAPVLKQNGGGAFVQLNSVASLKSFPDFATYSASKAASYSLTQALRATLSEQGTQVLSVHPGPIDTDMAEDAGLKEMAEPPSLVGSGIMDALKVGQFHLFPDSFARQVGAAYANFAEDVVEADLTEG
jgi:NAD(P)-dependent dehydrogenase (short-subunit alcohol dehydrogenase family)